jgi:osmotically-inducible protein OsmY
MLATVLGVAMVASGCAASGSESAEMSGKAKPAVASERPGDRTIEVWVRDALQQDPRVASDDIAVHAVDGIVTLSGTVENVAEASYAKRETAKIDGVRGIIDEVHIAPAVRDDDAIRTDIVRRLAENPRLHPEGLTVVVDKGDVTLAGGVPSWVERSEAGTMAGEVRGVRSVQNDLAVRYDETVSDDEARDDVVDALDRDPYLTGFPLTVRVHEGVATLEGTVGSLYEKDRAESDAFAAAPLTRVDNRLFVDWFEEKGVRETEPRPTDHQVASEIRDTLDLDMRISDPSKISVDVAGRFVTLDGTVLDDYQKRIAEEDAHGATGVLGVNNRLVADEATRSDDAIRGAVRVELDTDYAINGPDIGIEVNDGVVTLDGVVGNTFLRQHASEIASRVAGVRAVMNEITVSPDRGYTDSAIKERIQRHLASNWKTRSIADDVQVTVNDGVAHLEGSVDTWSERLEAERVARLTDGVAGVDDDLIVVFGPSSFDNG